METERLPAISYRSGDGGWIELTELTELPSGQVRETAWSSYPTADSLTTHGPPLPQLVDHLAAGETQPNLRAKFFSTAACRSGMYEETASEMMVVR